MKYVLDSSALIDLKHHYPEIFPSLWNKLSELAENGNIISVKEAYNEVSGRGDFISEWAEKYSTIFETPNQEEIEIVTGILSKHPELIKKESFSSGRPVADPFLIAKASVNNLILVTNETYIPNAHKIPNICAEYGVHYINLKGFMEKEEWKF